MMQMFQLKNDCGRLRNVTEEGYAELLVVVVAVDLSLAVVVLELLLPWGNFQHHLWDLGTGAFQKQPGETCFSHGDSKIECKQ